MGDFNNRKRSKDGKRTQCRSCENAYSAAWKKQNPEKHAQLNKKSYDRLSQSSEWKAKKAEYWRLMRIKNPDLFKAIQDRRLNKIRGTLEYKLSVASRNLMKRVNTGHNSKKVSYTAQKLKQRIEFNFRNGMSWDNWGDWHIDHTKPVKRFLDQGITDITIINALCNLRPLWAKDNLSKGAKF